MARTLLRVATNPYIRLTCAAATLAFAGLLVRAQPMPVTPPVTTPMPSPAMPPASMPAATQPTTEEAMFDRLLGNNEADADQPIQPSGPKMIDLTGGPNAIPPNAPQQATRREGTYLPRTIGRMTKAADGSWEFTLEADGAALQDPPLKLLPNLKLMAMEQQLETLNRDVRFRISGPITEYRGRNYVLVEEVVVVRDPP